jgi:hypothetical protein
MMLRVQAEDTAAARRHRLLCWLAVSHAVVILGTMFPVMQDAETNRTWPLWTGVTTLWFFWPLILSLHPGRAKRRVYVAAGLSAALIALPMHVYCSIVAPHVFAPGGDISVMSPYAAVPYAYGFVRGWAEGKRRAGRGTIVVECYGFGCYTPVAPPFSEEMRSKYRIETDAIAGCGVNDYILGHARGYNIASVREINRRYGSAVISVAEKQETERQELWASKRASGIADAENDARNGRLAILLYQPATDEDAYREMLRERYRTELRRVAATPQEMKEDELSYVWGYNEAATRELARRFGDDAQRAAWLVGTQSFASFMHPRPAQRAPK